MFYSDDPVRDFDRYDSDRARRKRPVCSCCDEEITDEFAFNLDGEWFCEECMDSFKVEVEEE